MLRYYRVDDASGRREEISHDRALRIVTGTYKDCDMVRDMLTIVNRITCNYSNIEIESDERATGGMHMVLMAGLQNMIPNGYKYDDDGNRIE